MHTPELLAYLPSPPQGVWHLGPVPIRAYALCIIIGVIVAVWLGERRWAARGGSPGMVTDIATWAVPFGLVGARAYHVVTDYQLYFGPGDNWVGIFKVWNGGLGIWGAIALGALGAWIACRRRGIPLPAVADALAPGIVLAQAIGRWGNYFNQELYGRPSTLPWALKIEPSQRLPGYLDVATYHPTFLYESLWCVGVALLVIWADRRFQLGHGQAFALYVAVYTVGRGWIEALRIDPAHHILGLRLNDWTSIAVFLCAVAYIWINRHKAREQLVEPAPEEATVDEHSGEPEGDGNAQPVVADGEPETPRSADGAAADTGGRASDGEGSETPESAKPTRSTEP